jgi:hypothetical protein
LPKLADLQVVFLTGSTVCKSGEKQKREDLRRSRSRRRR